MPLFIQFCCIWHYVLVIYETFLLASLHNFTPIVNHYYKGSYKCDSELNTNYQRASLLVEV